MSYNLGPFTLADGVNFDLDTKVNADLQQALFLQNESPLAVTLNGYSGDFNHTLTPGAHIMIRSDHSSAKINVAPFFQGSPQTADTSLLYATLFLNDEKMFEPGYTQMAVRGLSKVGPQYTYNRINAASGDLVITEIAPTGKNFYLQGFMVTGGIGTAPKTLKITIAGGVTTLVYFVAENTTDAVYFREEYTQTHPSTDGTMTITFGAGNASHSLDVWGYTQ